MRQEQSAQRLSILSLSIAAASILVCSTSLLSTAAYGAPVAQTTAEQRRAAHDLDRLFGEEMKMAGVKLKWHGERLTEDTIYALALTGASWEPAWGKETMFSLAWGDARKVPALNKRNQRGRDNITTEIAGLYQAKQYRKLVETATSSFSLDEIGVDVNLKQWVGDSLLHLGQPEQAFPIFAAPFEPNPADSRSAEYNRRFREEALVSAERAGLRKEVIAFTLSLVLDPDTEDPKPDLRRIGMLEQAGVDFDRILLGILQSPERLRGLPTYFYAAADLMAYRASPRLFPFLLQLADSSDVYLKSRALVGLGMVAFHSRAAEGADRTDQIIYATPREYGISSGERKLVERTLRDAIGSDKYRVRAAAALAIGLIGDAESELTLQKLTKDRAYIMLAENGERSKTRRVLFPVRMAAAAALERFGVRVDAGGGTFSGRDLDKARRGGSDETMDHRNLRKEVGSLITISPIDSATAVPFR